MPTDNFEEGAMVAFNSTPLTRQTFLRTIGLGAAALSLNQIVRAEEKPIQGFEKAKAAEDPSKGSMRSTLSPAM